MKILFVTPRLPLPADTGAKIRTFNLLKNVAKDNAVSLLSFYFEEKGLRKAIEQLKSFGIELYLVKAKEKVSLLSVFSDKPVSIEKYRSKEMENKLKELIGNNGFGLVHFDHLHMGQYRDCVNGLPCVLDEHNVESLILDRCAEVERNYLKRKLFKSQARKMGIFESNLTREFSKCLTVSQADKENLSQLSGIGANIEVIPNGVDIEYFKSPVHSPQSTENALVFTGSMDWLPNNDAAIYFCREILPLIWLKDTRVKFYIVGKNPSDELLKLSKQDNRIVVTGAVNDVRPYIAEAKVFVVPLRIGGGTRLKILEAFAMEKPVVSTTIGAEGIEYSEDVNILLADNPQGFADKVIALLNNCEDAQKIGFSARRLACEKYDWGIVVKKLNEAYREITNVR